VSTTPSPAIGTIAGFDLTVPDAESVRDFYAAVIGWTSDPFDMGGYADYFMKSPETDAISAGIVHDRGENADLPPQWIAYIVVADLEASLARCRELGGELLTPIKGSEGASHYCVIRDPAGAVLALMQLG
jgi:predicted enzyme related to lactoylglutathione lyase